jgi:hypothetical protein
MVTLPGKPTYGSTFLPPNALLLLFKDPNAPLAPADFVLSIRETGEEIGRLGSSRQQGVYYIQSALGDDGRTYWGRHKYAGAPGVTIPLDPLQLIAALGVTELPEDLTQPPAVGLEISDHPCEYVLTTIDRQPVTGRVLFRRKIHVPWDPDKPRRPNKVVFLDNGGKPIVHAELSGYEPIGDGDAAAVVPTDVSVTWRHWPRTAEDKYAETRLRIVLSEVRTEGGHPDACLLDFDALDPATTIQVDRHLDPKGERR